MSPQHDRNVATRPESRFAGWPGRCAKALGQMSREELLVALGRAHQAGDRPLALALYRELGGAEGDEWAFE
jgi:hypothetical protein